MKNNMVKWAIRFSIALNLFGLIVVFTPLTETMYRPLIFDEPPGKRELIVIFSANIYSDGTPDFQTDTRLRKGAELYHAGVAPKIISLGGGIFADDGTPMAQAMNRQLHKRYGIPTAALLTHTETNHTYADITSMLARFGERFDFNNTAWVSSAFHTFRIKQILLKKGITGPVIAAEPYGMHPRIPLERVLTFRSISREYMAIVYSWLAGWL